MDTLANYFCSKERARDYLSFINFRVGDRDNFISLGGKKGRGITFEVPRNSLMTAIDYEIFDDLLIGNFMKTALHEMGSLYDGDFNFARFLASAPQCGAAGARGLQPPARTVGLPLNQISRGRPHARSDEALE